MIKIDSFYDKYCDVRFELNPVRPSNIFEPELGRAIANKKSGNLYIGDDGKIYERIANVSIDTTVKGLREINKLAQEKFSQRIQKLQEQLDQFKLLQELTKNKPAKKGD